MIWSRLTQFGVQLLMTLRARTSPKRHEPVTVRCPRILHSSVLRRIAIGLAHREHSFSAAASPRRQDMKPPQPLRGCSNLASAGKSGAVAEKPSLWFILFVFALQPEAESHRRIPC